VRPRALQQPDDKTEPFVHPATLLAQHFASPRKGLEVLPMCPESGVTPLSGRATGVA